MSIQIPLDDCDETWNNLFEKKLTFYTKPQENLKYPGDPIALTCYRTDESYIYLPMGWTRKNIEISNTRIYPKTTFQPTVVARDLGQQAETNDVIDTLLEKNTVTLTVRTGGGKTFIFLNAACALQGKTLILVWISDHIDQIVNSIKEFTTASIGIVTTTGLDNPAADIVVCLYSRWHRMSLEFRREFMFLVVDELHLFYNKSGITAILAFQPKYAIGCTATFENAGSGMHQLAYPIFGKNYVSRAFDVPFHVTKILTGIVGTLEKNKYLKRGIDYNILTKSLINSPERNNCIVELVKIRLSEGSKILIITEQIYHAELLWKLLCDQNISCDYLAGTKKTYVDSDVIVGISKLVSCGFDEKSKCPTWKGTRINKVIIVKGVNTAHNLIQMLGRALRSTNPTIDHLVDKNSTSERQFINMAQEVYLPLNGTIEVCSLAVF